MTLPLSAHGNLRVALVHDWLNGMRGGEKVFEVLCELFPDATVFTLFYEPEQVSETIRRMKVVESGLAKLPGARRRYRLLLPLLPWAIEQFPTDEFDLVISTSHCVAKSALPPRRGRHLCYCFTPMRYIWDQFDQYFPSRGDLFSRTAMARAGRWKELADSMKQALRRRAMLALRPRLRGWDRATASRVDEFIADSRTVAGRIQRYYGRTASVIYPPVDCETFTPREAAFPPPPTPTPPQAPSAPALPALPTLTEIPAPAASIASIASIHSIPSIQPPPSAAEGYYLIVSALVPYKRVDRAIAAANELGRPLRIVGDGPEHDRLEAMAGPTVRMTGWLDTPALVEAYRGARALLYPGEEDFGITALEAQACGRPVIALGRGGARETVVHDRTGLLYADPSPTGLMRAIEEFEQKTFDPAQCRAQAERFARPRFRAELEAAISRHIEECL